MLSESIQQTVSSLRLHEMDLEESKTHKTVVASGNIAFQVHKMPHQPNSPLGLDVGMLSPTPVLGPQRQPRSKAKEPLLRLKKNLSSLRKNQSKLHFYLERGHLSPDGAKQISRTLAPSPINGEKTSKERQKV